jgi:hypothetical protein
VSNLVPIVARCPRCHAEERATVFDSLNADVLLHLAAEVADGTFETRACPGCGERFRPEHHMLFAQLSTRTWIVMQPLADRPRHALLERGVATVITQGFAQAPPLVTARLAGVRPRLVFGQHMLTEAVRCARAGLEPALVECAKLLAFRDRLLELMRYGPCELAFEAIGDDDALRLGVHALPGGVRLDELVVPGALLAEVRAGRVVLEQQHPELFNRPYVSATRYLVGDTT